MANRIYKTAGGKAASPSQCGMSVLSSHGSPALQQGGATTHVCARSRVLACAVRRLSLPRALYGEDEVPRLGHAGEIRPAAERRAAFQSAQVARDGKLINACLAILAKSSTLFGVSIFRTPVTWACFNGCKEPTKASDSQISDYFP